MKLIKLLCGFGFLLLLASNVWAISRWSESRGVYDDICYLRQAHLFQKFGMRGLDTNITLDNDRYLAGKLKEIGFPTWNDVKTAPCHTFIPAADKWVMQYPPGTGLVLAMFPSGFQVKPLYVLANVIISCFALLGLFYARQPASVALAAVFGFAAIYLMINPAKASYSMAPTMVVCALAGFLTAGLFAGEPRRRLMLAAAVGLLIGLSVNFRLPNLLLSAGYALFFLCAFLRTRNADTFLQGAAFGIAFLVGLAPTLTRERDQRGKSACDDLWRRRRRAARTEFERALAVCQGCAVHVAGDRSRVDRLAVAFRPAETAGRACGRGESRGQSDLLHDPSDLHALLHDPRGHAVAVDPFVRDSRLERRAGGGKVGLAAAGQNLNTV